MNGTLAAGDPASTERALTERGALYQFSDDLVTLTEGRAAEAEAIRTARTHVIARHLEDGRRGLAICAARPGDGCSFVAANLAVSLSQAGVATLLIDADLRTPRIDSLIRPETPPSGLRQCLSDPDPQPSSYLHPEVLPNLSVLFAGGAAANAQELLAGEAFKRLVDRCLRDFEFTIIDTPPAMTCADAVRISTIIGYSLVVAKNHVSRLSDVSELAGQLQEDGARVVGAVLNEV